MRPGVDFSGPLYDATLEDPPEPGSWGAACLSSACVTDTLWTEPSRRYVPVISVVVIRPSYSSTASRPRLDIPVINHRGRRRRSQE